MKLRYLASILGALCSLLHAHAQPLPARQTTLPGTYRISAGTQLSYETPLAPLAGYLREGEKAAATGFDWQKREDVWDKVKEETAEVEAEMRSGDKANLEAEFGDLFFALVNAARLYGVDPESALERTNKKFIRRFNYMEEQAAAQGNSLHDLSLGEMEALWQEAKKGE